MTMDSFPLNKAHQQERKAEALLKQRKFDEAIECHKKSMELLTEACKMTEHQRSLESLRLQHDYHRKQINMVQIKKEQLEHYKKSLLVKHNRKNSESSTEVENEHVEEGSLQAVINRTIEVHDSLIDYLVRRGTGSDNDSLKSSSTSDMEEKVERDSAPIIGNKHPKDDSQIIEELKLLSGQLRDSVQCLLGQLDDRNKEIEQLKHKIKALEYEKQAHSKNNSSLKVVTDSSGGTSPYIFSPCSELSPDVVNEIRTLPPLAPLEMPNFDILNLIKSNTTNNNIN